MLEQSGSFEQTGDRGRFRVTYFTPSLTGLNTSSPAYRFACVETRRSSNGGQITGLVETTIDGAREFIAVTELSAVALSETLLGFGCGRIAVDATDHDPTVEIRVASSGGQYVSGEPCNARPDQVAGTQPSPSVCVGPDDRTFQVALRWAGPFAHAQAFQATRESGLFLRFADNVSQGAALGPVQDTALVQVIDSCDVDGLFSVSYGVSTGTFDTTIRDIACGGTHTAPTSIPCICSP